MSSRWFCGLLVSVCLAAAFQIFAQPANDECGGSTPLLLDTIHRMNTTAATSPNDPTEVCGEPFGCSVWFSFTPPQSGRATLTTCGSDFDTAFQIYTGSCTNLTPFLCSDDLGPTCPTQQASAAFLVYEGVTYLICVGGYAGASGNLEIAVSMPAPPNDECSGALPLTPGVPVAVNTANATQGTDTVAWCAYGLNAGVWFSFTTSSSDLVTIDTAGSDFQTAMAVYSGNCGNLNLLACATTRIQFFGTNGTTYLVLVGGEVGAPKGNIQITAVQGTPSNDDCSAAIPMTEGITYSINALGATGGDMPGSGCFNVPGIWYSFTPVADSIVTVSTCGSDPGSLQVFSGSCTSLVSVVDGCASIYAACTNNESALAFRGSAGVTYRILAASKGTLNIRATTAPILANDTCTGTIQMTEGVTYTADTAHASSDGDTGPCYPATRGVWYSFRPPETSLVTVSTCGSGLRTALQVFSGHCGALVPVLDGCNAGFGPACEGDQASVSFRAEANMLYYILASSRYSPPGLLTIRATTAPLLPNDTCAGATPMLPGVTYTADTARASSDGDPSPSCASIRKGVWYTFTPPQDGVVNISSSGSDFDVRFQVFTGICGSLAEIADGCNKNAFKATAGVTYRILAGGALGAVGSLNIAATLGPPLPNDEPSGAIPMADGIVYTQSTTNATSTFGSKDVWYSFTPASNCIVTVTTCASDYYPYLSVSSSSQGYIEFIPAPEFCPTNAAYLSFRAFPTVTYLIGVTDPSGRGGTLNIKATQSPPMPNDDCSGAIPLAFGEVYSESTALATSIGDPYVYYGSLTKGVWFTITPLVSDKVTISTCGTDFDTIMQVYSGTCDSLLPVTTGFGRFDKPPCDQGRASAIFSATANTTYYIVVGGFRGITGNLEIKASLPPPRNSGFNGAIPLLANRTITVNTTYGISTNQFVPDCGTNFANGVWFTFLAPTSSEVTLETCRSDFPTVLQVYTGDYPSLQPLACNAGNGPACGTARASLSFFGHTGTRYAILAGGQDGASGNLSIVAHVPPPPNAFCSGAIPLTNGIPFLMNTTHALFGSDLLPTCCTNFGNAVWFSYKPPTDGPVAISTCGSGFDTVLGVYSGTCAALVPLVCNDDSGPVCATNQASASFFASAQAHYLILVGGYSGAAGNLNITATRLPPPPNQDCASAIPMLTGIPYGGNTFDARTPTGGLPLCHTNISHALWYTLTPQVSGLVGVSTCGSDFDTVLHLFTGECGSLVPLDGGCNDDLGPFCGSVSASLSFLGTAGTKYWLLVGGYGTNWGDLEISAGVLPPMGIKVDQGYAQVSWPANVGALHLDFTTDLAAPVIWTPWYYGAEGTNFVARAYMRNIGPKAFFRLRP